MCKYLQIKISVNNKMVVNKKEYIRNYMREYRKIRKQNNKEIIPLWKTNDYKLTDKTISQYVKIIMRITLKFKFSIPRDLPETLEKIFKEEANDNDYDFVITTLSFIGRSFVKKLKMIYDNENSIKTNLIPFVRLLSMAKNKKLNKIYQVLKNEIIKLNTYYEKKRDDNEVKKEDENKIINYDKELITANLDKLEDLEEKAIYGIYTLLPPRRLEYSDMYIKTGNSKEEPDKNYLITYKKRPIKFIFNNYKTVKKFGKQVIDIPDDLSNILYEYLKNNKMKSGDKLFRYNLNYMGKALSKVLSKVYGEDGITLNWLRRSYATYLDTLKISNNDREVYSIMMAHSYTQNLKYRKIITMKEK